MNVVNSFSELPGSGDCRCIGGNASFQTIKECQSADGKVWNDDAVDNMVGISYANPQVEAECTPGNIEFGGDGGNPKNHIVLEKQLKRLERAITLEELKGRKELRGVRDNKGNFHSLKDDRAGQLAGALHGGWRLIFVPKHDPIPVDANGNLDWSKVTEIEIQEITDYH